MDASLAEFLDVASTYELGEFGSGSLDSAIWDEHHVTLGITLRHQDQPEQQWELHCAFVRDSRLCGGREINCLSWEAEHPLLLPYVSPDVELWFRGRPDDVGVVVAELVEAHHAVVADWFGWTHFLNVTSCLRPHHLLAGGFGSFARGRQPLVEAYAQVLARHGMATSFSPPRPPVWWDGVRHVALTETSYVLVLCSSYVVSPAVTARRR